MATMDDEHEHEHEQPQPFLTRVSSRMKAAGAWIHRELGLLTLRRAPVDAHLLLASRFVRMFAISSSALILALYFSVLGHSDTKIGLFMTLTLLGDVGISLLLTLVADQLGRRRVLMLGGVLMAGSGVVFATMGGYWWLLAAAVLGVISPSGNEIGSFRAIEESTLSQLIPPEARTDIFAWYVVAGTAATACGSLACGWSVQYLIHQRHFSAIRAYRAVFLAYACIGLIKTCLALCLSDKCEVVKKIDLADVMAVEDDDETQPLLDDTRSTPERIREEDEQRKKKEKKGWFGEMSTHTWLILAKLLPLFAVDSFSSGLVPFSLITFYIDRKFHPPQGLLGTIMSVAQLFAVFSNIFASAIAKRIGLVKTMVFTHLPSAIFLLLFPFPTVLPWTILLLILRSILGSMDQAPRSAFIAAVVLPQERTAVMGIVNVGKTLSQSVGPVVTGWLAGGGRFWVAFVVAGGLKVSYDLGLLTMFLNTKTDRGGNAEREERERQEQQQVGTGTARSRA